MATSAPSLRQASHFSAEPAVVMTRAPNSLASMMAVVPMPEVPPCTSSVSPFLQRAALEHIVPDGEEGLRHGGGFDHRQAADRQRVALMRERVFGVAAADDQRHDLVADLPARSARAERDDFAGDFEAREYRARRAAAGSCPGAA